jgi:hypothetical protein
MKHKTSNIKVYLLALRKSKCKILKISGLTFIGIIGLKRTLAFFQKVGNDLFALNSYYKNCF